MRVVKTSLFLAACLAVGGPATLLAHHSFAAEFDDTKPVKMTGVIKKVEWTNPHIWSQEFQIVAKPEWDAAGLYEYVCEDNNRRPGGTCGAK